MLQRKSPQATARFPPSDCYNAAVSRTLLMASALLVATVCAAQQAIAAALAAIPKRPAFSADFEIDRGRSLLDPSSNPLMAAGTPQPAGETAVADFVRMRHDMSGSSQYSTVQYSFSRDTKQMV